jgi:hypothetical protein
MPRCVARLWNVHEGCLSLGSPVFWGDSHAALRIRRHRGGIPIQVPATSRAVPWLGRPAGKERIFGIPVCQLARSRAGRLICVVIGPKAFAFRRQRQTGQFKTIMLLVPSQPSFPAVSLPRS